MDPRSLCRASAAQLLNNLSPVEPQLRRCILEDHEQAHAPPPMPPTALKHAAGACWRDWAATASHGGASATHAYTRGREAWQPAVGRRRADLTLSARTDYIIEHHTQT